MKLAKEPHNIRYTIDTMNQRRLERTEDSHILQAESPVESDAQLRFYFTCID